MAPAEIRFLPAPRKTTALLTKPMRQRLVGGLDLINQKAPWEYVIDQLELNGGLEGLDVSDANQLLAIMDNQGRAKMGPKVLAMIEHAGLKANTITYDLIIHGHSGLKDSAKIRELFAEMTESKHHLVEYFRLPTDVTSRENCSV